MGEIIAWYYWCQNYDANSSKKNFVVLHIFSPQAGTVWLFAMLCCADWVQTKEGAAMCLCPEMLRVKKAV